MWRLFSRLLHRPMRSQRSRTSTSSFAFFPFFFGCTLIFCFLHKSVSSILAYLGSQPTFLGFLLGIWWVVSSMVCGLCTRLGAVLDLVSHGRADGGWMALVDGLLDGSRFPGFFTRDRLACCSPVCRWTFLLLTQEDG